MIKVRVDWHQKCSGCGTEIVCDFLDDSVCRQICPWCGRECDVGEAAGNRDLRDYAAKAANEIEKKVNGGIPV